MSLARTKRPKLLSVICVIGFIWMILVLPGIFSPSVKRMGDFIPMIYGLIRAATFISLIGVWHMKKWGVELFTLVFFIRTSFFIATDQMTFGTYAGIVFSLLFILAFFIFYRRMDRNL
jgi:hypothetical protein